MIKNKKSVGTAVSPHIPTADEIADMADRGEDISRFFTNRGTMKYPTQQVKIELPDSMAAELDQLANELHLNVQAVIVTYIRQALDQHYLAKQHVKKIVNQ